MKIISEDLIDVAANEYNSLDAFVNIAFKVGAEFAEQELKNLAIEFAEWNAKLGFKYDKATKRWYICKNGHKFTTKQNFDQFIKGKMQ